MPLPSPRPEGVVTFPSIESMKESTLPDGSIQLTVPWPLEVEELKALLGDRLQKFRVVHLTNASKVRFRV